MPTPPSELHDISQEAPMEVRTETPDNEATPPQTDDLTADCDCDDDTRPQAETPPTDTDADALLLPGGIALPDCDNEEVSRDDSGALLPRGWSGAGVVGPAGSVRPNFRPYRRYRTPATFLR